jgi:hypothetical protein
MPNKKSQPIDVEDASQLSMLAYQVKTRPAGQFDLKAFVSKLKSPRAKRIAGILVGENDAGATDAPPANSDPNDETLRQANYYQQWAEETARTAVAASRRPTRRRRAG